ncbi:MAG: hypothetical protein ACO2ZM_02595, partial [Francisellaceae bacterium]
NGSTPLYKVFNFLGSFQQLFKVIFLITALISLSACSFLLPTKETYKTDRWHSFEDVYDIYNKIEPGKTDVSMLKHYGFDPYLATNVRIDSYLDIRARFDPLGIDRNVPEPVQHCLLSFNLCKAYIVNVDYSYSKRIGNAFLDIAGFRKETITTGWQFQAVFIIEGDIVVYKLWSGEPKKETYSDEINPLGPFQSFGGIVVAPIAIEIPT